NTPSACKSRGATGVYELNDKSDVAECSRSLHTTVTLCWSWSPRSRSGGAAEALRTYQLPLIKYAFMDDRPNFFAGSHIDRRAEAREDFRWLEAALSDSETLYLLGRGTSHLVHTNPQPRIAFLTREHPVVHEVDTSRLVLLGWFRNTRCVLID